MDQVRFLFELYDGFTVLFWITVLILLFISLRTRKKRGIRTEEDIKHDVLVLVGEKWTPVRRVVLLYNMKHRGPHDVQLSEASIMQILKELHDSGEIYMQYREPEPDDLDILPGDVMSGERALMCRRRT